MYTLQAGSELILHNVFNAKLISLDLSPLGFKAIFFSAVLLYLVYNFELINCSFQNSRNTALHALSSVMVLTGNSFTNNSAENPGGAILALHSHMAVYNHWTGLVDWTGGLDWWTDTKNHFLVSGKPSSC